MTSRRASRRTPSFSSSSSSSLSSISSSLDDHSSPSTPLGYTGIPFSWEQFPGIPKKHNTKKPSSQCPLPLPPPSGFVSGNSFRKSFRKDSTPMMRKYSTGGDRSFHEDPFFAALVECSKDDQKKANKKASKMQSRGGFGGLYTSCLRTGEVAESLVFLPRSRSGYYFR